jgi:hypothetical protein
MGEKFDQARRDCGTGGLDSIVRYCFMIAGEFMPTVIQQEILELLHFATGLIGYSGYAIS